MIRIGEMNELEYQRKTDAGLILGNDQERVILPFMHAPKGLEPGDTLQVFVYMNSDGRMMATTQTPLATAGQFAYLKAVDSSEHGVYLDLGIEKDVFAPARAQKKPMRVGEKYVVYIHLDDRNHRLLASSRLSDFARQEDFDLEAGDPADLLIAEQSDLGYTAVINQKFLGLLYRNEVFDQLRIGEKRKGYIKKIREENKIDLTLQPQGYGHVLETRDMLLQKLEENGGVLELGDKTSPEEITRRLHISKKVFKKTIGSLYKERLIEIGDHEIRLSKTSGQ
ncbi:MAG TPA: S1-like domain-containing RNA-binding protein [Sphingobacteriaceae bacterium]